MTQLSDLSGLTLEDTPEETMVIRSLVDRALQRRFDSWYDGTGYTIQTQSESRRTKVLNWDFRRTAKCWKFFIQGALEADGRPVVRCMVCGDVLGHGGFFGPTSMTSHLKKIRHLKKGKELVYGLESKAGEPTEEELLDYLKRIGSEGMLVCIDSGYEI